MGVEDFHGVLARKLPLPCTVMAAISVLGAGVVCEHFQGMSARRAAVIDDGVLEAHVLGGLPLCLGAHQKANVRVALVRGTAQPLSH